MTPSTCSTSREVLESAAVPAARRLRASGDYILSQVFEQQQGVDH